jgi:hypothetical protein
MIEDKIYSSENVKVFLNDVELTEDELLNECPGIKINPKTITITVKGGSEPHKILNKAKQREKVKLEVVMTSGARNWKMPFAFVYKLTPSKWGLRTFRNPLSGEMTKIENFEIVFTGTIYDSDDK